MKFIFLGDTHGNINRCRSVAESNPFDVIVQIGDLGCGFVPNEVITDLPVNFMFFVGNHDNRNVANTLWNCIGDFGAYENKFFFVSGADSIDKNMRVEGVSWWRNEELNTMQGMDCFDAWVNSNLDVLVTHDIPQSFAEQYQNIHDKSFTRTLLQKMIEARKPKLLVSGHHHCSKDIETFNGIRWRALGIDETFSIDI